MFERLLALDALSKYVDAEQLSRANVEAICISRGWKTGGKSQKKSTSVAAAKIKNIYADKLVQEVRDLLTARGLSAEGKKADLIIRLVEDDADRLRQEQDPGQVPGQVQQEQEMGQGYADVAALGEQLDARMLQNMVLARAAPVPASIYDPAVADAVAASLASAQAAIEASASASKTKKYREIEIKGIGMPPEEFTPAGTPQVSTAVLRKMAGKNLDNGRLSIYSCFGM